VIPTCSCPRDPGGEIVANDTSCQVHGWNHAKGCACPRFATGEVAARTANCAVHGHSLFAATHPEPPPQPNAGQPVWEAVIEDMRARDNLGRAKYGTPLQWFNGRDPLVDLYQELLDAVVYLKQELMERAAR
jgi:hypothetical protein